MSTEETMITLVVSVAVVYLIRSVYRFAWLRRQEEFDAHVRRTFPAGRIAPNAVRDAKIEDGTITHGVNGHVLDKDGYCRACAHFYFNGN